MKTVLVTGGNGYVASTLLGSLSKESIRCLATVRSSATRLRNADKLFVTGDIDSSTSWDILDEPIDVVIHCAGVAHVKSSDMYFEVNEYATAKLATKALQLGVKKFIYISSCAVYGDKLHDTVVDEDVSCTPSTAYGLSKLNAENALVKIFNDSQVQLIVLRPPIIYGANCPGNFARLVRLVAMNIPLPFKSLSNRKDMVSVNNLTDLINTMITSDYSASGIYNVSDAEPVTLSELLNAIGAAIGKKVKLFGLNYWLLFSIGKILRKSKEIEKLATQGLIRTDKVRSAYDWEPRYNSSEEFRIAARSFMDL